MPKKSTEPEFVTILARTTEEAFREFNRQGLGKQGYLIDGRMARHRFSLVDGGAPQDLEALSQMVVATFRRS